jgi:hypothetical protein
MEKRKGVMANWLKILSLYLIEKGKVFPLQAWTGPEGSRRLRLPNV